MSYNYSKKDNDNTDVTYDEDGLYFYPDDTASSLEDNSDDEIIYEFEEDDSFNNKAKADNNISYSNNSDDVIDYTKNKNKSSITHIILREVFSYIKIILCAIAIAFLLTQFVIMNAEVPTGSMIDTINIQDRLIGFRLAYLFSEPKRRDVVIFKFPDNENETYVKRIIGIPGDVIQIQNGHVYLNGSELHEDYLYEDMLQKGEDSTYVVPDDCYFMLGDNRNQSADSRYWSNPYVNKKKILAKAVFRYYDGKTKNISFKLIK